MTQCSHYIRKCLFFTPCCNNVYACRFCHDHSEGHELDRRSVEDIVCSQCSKKQALATHCIECGIRFGMYACLQCRLFDDEDKKQFHCEKCGVCRVGGAENFFHCNVCDICLQKSLLSSHKCRNESGRDVCPVCFEAVHSSSEPSFVPKCGHFIHLKCYQLIEKFGHVQCPLCKQNYTEGGETMNRVRVLPFIADN